MKQAYEALGVIETVTSNPSRFTNMALQRIAQVLHKRIVDLTDYVETLNDPSSHNGLDDLMFGGMNAIVEGRAAIGLTTAWFEPMVNSLQRTTDHTSQTVMVWSFVDGLLFGGYADGSNGCSSLGEREVAAAKARLVLKIARELQFYRGREVAMISTSIDFAELTKQKNWLLGQESEEAAGLVAFLDSTQDAIVVTSALTEKDVFPSMEEED